MKKYGLLLLLFLSISCSKVLHLTEVKPESTKVDTSSEIAPDSEIMAMIAPYKKQLDKEVNKIIGQSAITMQKARPQSTLGNWFADLVHHQAEKQYAQSIDFAIVNYGGIRISELTKGPVTLGKIYELMPFENMLVVLKVKGDIVQKLFDHMAMLGGWPISKQVRYEIKNKNAQNILINEKSIDSSQTYSIALADFIANGGNNCFFLKDQPREDNGYLLRAAIIDFIEAETAQGKLLDAEIDHRVRLIE